MSFRSSTAHCAACAMSVLLLLSGCATSQYGEQITTVNYYPQCYEPIGSLREADKSFNKTVVAGSVIGALAGAAVGALATGKIQGAAIGAVAGGAAGAGVGYAKAKQNRIADDNQRMASYLTDIDGDISGIDRATAAARVARSCYDKAFQTALADYKAGRITRDDLTNRYQEIKNGSTEAGTILGKVIASTSDKEQQYNDALQAEAKRANRPVPTVPDNAYTYETPKTTTTAAAPATTTKKSTAPAKVSSSSSGSSSSSTTGASSSSASSSTSASTSSNNGTTTMKTAAPRQGDTSLEAMAQNTQRLNESRQSALQEQESIRQMQQEMDSTLATIKS